MPTIHLQVCAGFANRVRAMISGICLAEDVQLPLVIHWFPKSPECACRFASVLDPESLPKTVKIVPEDIYQAYDVQTKDDWNKLDSYWDKKTDISIKSHGIFFSNDRYDFHLRNLKPSSWVKDFLLRRTSHVDWSTAIGVHIRRTDHKKAIQGSPLESFLEKMRKEPDAFFVVATDDKDVKEQIEQEFLARCVFPAIRLTRNTEEGMIQGVADFFALSKCQNLWGSYWSSFSELSAKYGKIECEVVT